MKKAAWVLSVLILTQAGAAFAAQPGTPEYEKMKELKKAQRMQRETAKASNKPESTFWKREGERSGLNQWGGASGIFSSLNPVPFFKEQGKRYDERKAGTK